MNENSCLEFLYYSNSVGDIKTSSESDGHRLVAYPIADADQKAYGVKASDTVLTSRLNWPGFKLVQEKGKGSKFARIDYKNFTPFFKDLFEGINFNALNHNTHKSVLQLY